MQDRERVVRETMTNQEMYEWVMAQVLRQAQRSPDPSTQNGAVLIMENRDVRWVTASVNEFPAGVEYTDERWVRPNKYQYIEHAERNCIYRAARYGISTFGGTMVCPWAACSDCARAIIQAGVQTLVTLSPTDNTNERWMDSIAIAMQMLKEGGVTVHYLEMAEPAGVLLRRDGQEVAF